MIYIGDVSTNDFLILKELAENNKNILEFGVGASTQIISNYCSNDFISLDTSYDWVKKTIKNIDDLGIKKCVTFIKYSDFKFNGEYDFVFNDGIDSLRNEFGLKIWKNIKVGGVIAYHDTRRSKDIANVCNLINEYFNEIGSVEINVKHSNITIIKKKALEPYENWNKVENRKNFAPNDYIFK